MLQSWLVDIRIMWSQAIRVIATRSGSPEGTDSDHLVSERAYWGGFRGSALSVAVIDGRGLPLLGSPINQSQTHRQSRLMAESVSDLLIWVSLYLDWLFRGQKYLDSQSLVTLL